MANDAARTWLLAIDGSAPSLAAARYVAAWAALLRVDEVRVVTAEAVEGYRAYALRREEVTADAVEHARKVAEEACAVLREAGVRFRFEAKLGDADAVIAAEAKRAQASEIVMGTRGLGEIPGLLVGSVAYKMIHAAEVAVTLVPPSEGPRRQADRHRILLALDGSAPAQRALDYVLALGEAASRIDVELVHVAVGNERDADDAPADTDAAAGMLDDAAKALRDRGFACETHVARGPLARTLVARSQDSECARIVMGKRGLGAMQSLVVGSIAHAVTHLSPLPVTLVH